MMPIATRTRNEGTRVKIASSLCPAGDLQHCFHLCPMVSTFWTQFEHRTSLAYWSIGHHWSICSFQIAVKVKVVNIGYSLCAAIKSKKGASCVTFSQGI